MKTFKQLIPSENYRQIDVFCLPENGGEKQIIAKNPRKKLLIDPMGRYSKLKLGESTQFTGQTWLKRIT